MNQGTTMKYNDVEKDFLLCNQYGFSGIELKYNMVKDYSTEYIKQLSYNNDVRVGSLSGILLPILQAENIRQQCKMRFDNMCSFAQKVNAPYIVAYPARGKINEDESIIESDTIDILKEYSDIAEEYGIKIALEVTGYKDSYLNKISDGLKIINMLACECIGLVYDFYHVFGTEDLGQAIYLSKKK